MKGVYTETCLLDRNTLGVRVGADFTPHDWGLGPVVQYWDGVLTVSLRLGPFGVWLEVTW